MMTSTQIRQSFLDYFKSRQHTIVPSSSLMPDSPNLLFTNAGMNQFVPIFLGQTKCPYTPGRAADTQKCIRAGGKHNDLDDVGLDTYHHTFFEMLGNWSFGDYFKKEAIDWAWELVTGVWKFPRHRIYATVYNPDKFKGDPSEFDQEAWNYWAEKFRAAGLDPAIQIVHGSKNDNFWMMGETGPCGPCSELHVDLTPAGDTKGALVNKGSAECIEIWNLVFIQFNANPDGTFSALPAKHVDTGMGFERVTSIIQGTKGFTDFANARISNYETDIFRPIFDEIEKLSGKKYGSTLPEGAHAPSRTPVGVPPTEGEHTRPRVLQSAPSPIALGVPGSTEAKYSRRNLPHFERPWAKYMVTFSTRERRELTPSERDLTLKSVLYAHEHRQYQLYAACIMPDHVHLLFEPQIKEQDKEGNPVFWSLSEILQGIKSASAHNINRASRREGQVWEKESVDRMIRGQSDFEEKFHYICRNPWDASIATPTQNYSWLWTPEIAVWKEGTADGSGEHTRPRVSQSAPSPIASGGNAMQGSAPLDSSRPVLTARAQSATREGACAPQAAAPPLPQSEQEKIDVAFRVIGDHIRTLGFAIADGIQPGNTDRNYVLRRILRRAVRYGRTLGFHVPFFYKLVDVLADTMGDVFPEIRAKKKHVQEVLKAEEEAFNKTLDRGIELFGRSISGLGSSYALIFGPIGNTGGQAPSLATEADLEGALRQYSFFEPVAIHALRRALDLDDAKVRKMCEDRMIPKLLISVRDVAENKVQREKLVAAFCEVPARDAFELYDTYGFPLDLTELMARERGLTVDKEGFEKLMEVQRARARAAQKKIIIEVDEHGFPPTVFVGYENLKSECKLLSFVDKSNGPGKLSDYFAVVDVSPLYAEMGGQVSDTGKLYWKGRDEWLEIISTQKRGNVFYFKLDPARPFSLDQQGLLNVAVNGEAAALSVDKPRRHAIERHHTVTHLLHWALHEVVSKDASQKGSFVGPDKLTFDFNSAPLTHDQVAKIEQLVNERILENAGVSWTEVPYAEVKSREDVMQFFGDKYGDAVRVVQIGGSVDAETKRPKLDGYSMELCGGTHTRATGEIGLFRIVGENAIAAGVRRIEAVAGLPAIVTANYDRELTKALASKVNSPIHELEKKIESLLAHQKELEKQIKSAQQREASSIAANLKNQASTVNGIPAILYNLGTADGDLLQAVADALKASFKGVIVLGGVSNGAVSLVAAVSPEFTTKVQAGKIIQTIAPIVGGKGGGKPDNARGGGKDPSQLAEAIAKAKSLLG